MKEWKGLMLARRAWLKDQKMASMMGLSWGFCPRTAGQRIGDASEFSARPRGFDGGSVERGFS